MEVCLGELRTHEGSDVEVKSHFLFHVEDINNVINNVINIAMEIDTFEQIRELPLKGISISVESRKVQVDSHEHELLKELHARQNEIQSWQSLKLEGNSYSKQFFIWLGQLLPRAKGLLCLNANDVIVARSKPQVTVSLHSLSNGLVGSHLMRLDLSNNAVSCHGAEQLLIYLQQAYSLEVLLMSNCGLGPLGVAEIARGLKGAPHLRVLSLGRNRMEDAGIISIAECLMHLPRLQQLYVYQNTLRTQGLTPLLRNLCKNCPAIRSLDLGDNFLRETATMEMVELIRNNLQLRDLNLSDCLNEEQNDAIIKAFETTVNCKWERLGFNYAELNEEHAIRLLSVVRNYPLKRLDIVGNQFKKAMRKQYSEAFSTKGVLSVFNDDDEQELTRLFQELKI